MAIKLQELSFSYGDQPVFDHFSLDLPDSGTVCLYGPSGCGKTTVLRLLAGLEKPETGRIEGVQGTTFSFVFQENRLLPWMSVYENVAAVLPKPWNNEQIEDSLAMVGLEQASRKLPGELSGGMQRRVAIARALTYDGDVLLLDEPFNGLDMQLKQHMIGVISQQYRNRLIVLVTHNQEEAHQMGATLIKMNA